MSNYCFIKDDPKQERSPVSVLCDICCGQPRVSMGSLTYTCIQHLRLCSACTVVSHETTHKHCVVCGMSVNKGESYLEFDGAPHISSGFALCSDCFSEYVNIAEETDPEQEYKKSMREFVDRIKRSQHE